MHVNIFFSSGGLPADPTTYLPPSRSQGLPQGGRRWAAPSIASAQNKESNPGCGPCEPTHLPKAQNYPQQATPSFVGRRAFGTSLSPTCPNVHFPYIFIGKMTKRTYSTSADAGCTRPIRKR